MFPLLALVPAVAVTTWVAKKLFEDEHENLDKLLHDVSGRRLAIVGERETGKTTLHRFVEKGSVTVSYSATTFPEAVRGRRFELGALKVKAKRSKDVSGSDDRYRDWEAVIKEGDATLYLCRLDRLLEADEQTLDRIEQDARLIREVHPSTSKLLLVGTFADKVPGWIDSVCSGQQAQFEDDLRRNEDLRRLVGLLGGFSRVDVVLGALVAEPYGGGPSACEELVQEIFGRVYA